jgi:Domain of unknown function (DUF4214)
MKKVKLFSCCVAILTASFGAYFLATVGRAQTTNRQLRPDITRALKSSTRRGIHTRANAYRPARPVKQQALRQRSQLESTTLRNPVRLLPDVTPPASAPIASGTALSRVLHTSQLSMTSTAGTNEQFVDRNTDLVADDRTTFDSDGGSFDIAVGKSGSRYEVFSATLNNTPVGVIVIANDTNGDFVADSSSTFDLERDFDLPSAAAVVTGVSADNREFVIVSSSGFFNSSDPNDPNNEASPGIVLLVRDPNTGGFIAAQARTLVEVGDDQLFNANAMALMPNNDLLVADFESNELRIIRDTNADRMPDTLDTVPYYSYTFFNDAPLDIAVNTNGVVFSHSEGNDTFLLAIYDDDHNGRADRDEVAVEGLSVDNNLFLHGMTIDRNGTVYMIEDATSAFDGSGGNLGRARVDAFRDPQQNGFLEDGKIFVQADSDNFGLSGLSFGRSLNSVNDSEAFVRRHYLDFLNREADPEGLAFWINNIESCANDLQCREVKRVDTSAAFFFSIEFQETGFLVYRLYKTSFPPSAARPRGLPRFQEFTTDAQTVGNGVIVKQPNWPQKLEENTVAFINNFVARSEFQQQYPAQLTPAQYVDNLNTLAGGALSTTERNALVDGLTGGQETRATVLRKIANDVDFRNAEFNRGFVLMQYFGYLRRNPDDPPDGNFNGYDFWLNKLIQFNGDYRAAEMVKAFIQSLEYRDRFE